MTIRLLMTVAVILASLAGGYVVRKRGLLPQRVADWCMTFVAVFGYTAVSFLTIWVLDAPRVSDALLPVLAATHWAMMGLAALLGGRAIGLNFEDRGLLAVAGAAGNTGITMGGIVLYLLYGEQGLGLVSLYCLSWTPMTVLFHYPLARHFAHGADRPPLGRLMLQNLLDWRAVSLPISIVSIILCLARVPRPAFIDDLHVVDVLMVAVTAMAYFGIGMRLHLGDMGRLWKMILALGALRFGVGVGLGWSVVALLHLTPWPLEGLRLEVFVIESFVPSAVIGVAVASMFHLRPRCASILFVANTVMYLVLVLPIVMWLWGRGPGAG